jgi:tRNA-Thr(GGU) m(6)t(6)A37 methyltransferase TsaA
MCPSEKAANLITVQAIGTIRTPFLEAAGTPIQPVYGPDGEGRVLLDEAYAPALDDIEGFERLWLIYWMHRTGRFKARVVPYRDTKEHGLFATRSPNRPNPIGISVVRLLRRDGSTLHIAGVDMLDGTPLLDIKPYVPEFDACVNSRAGWFDKAGVDRRVADGRFHAPGSKGNQHLPE